MTSAQLRMARGALGWTVRELAEKAEVHRNTITRLESGAEGEPRTIQALRSALEAAGVIFIEQNGEGPGARLRKARPTAASKLNAP